MYCCTQEQARVAGTVKLLSGSIASGSRPARPHARKYSGDKVPVKKSAKLARRQTNNSEEKPDIKHLVYISSALI